MTTVEVLFPDVVAIVLDRLSERLAAAGEPTQTGTVVPIPRPDRLILARRTGGTRTSIVTDAAMVTVEAWADTPAAASDLAERCRSVIHAMAGTTVDDTPVYRVEDIAGPGDLPDPLSDQPRRTFTVQITIRGTGP